MAGNSRVGSDRSRMDRRGFLRAAALGAVTAAALTGCAAAGGRRPGSSTPAASPSASSAGGDGAWALLVYFSRAGENYYYGGRTRLAVGNTQVVAELIAALVTVDVYRIEAADPYPDGYDETVQRNSREMTDNARPAIANPLPDLARYDTILLGSPIWGMQPPMIMRTFVEALDFSGKRILPFTTHAMSGLGSAMSNYAEAAPDATIGDGMAVQGEEAAGAGAQVEEWLRASGLLARQETQEKAGS